VARDPFFDEIVVFELPTLTFAHYLLDHLGSDRFAWRHVPQSDTAVAVLLTSDELDLATLLRSVQSWIAQVGLRVVRFEVDGRTYALEADRERTTCV
jgi:hypothetical protein